MKTCNKRTADLNVVSATAAPPLGARSYSNFKMFKYLNNDLLQTELKCSPGGLSISIQRLTSCKCNVGPVY